MQDVPSAALVVFYLFDVAEQIDLEPLRAAIGGDAARARLAPKAAAPSYLQYSVPPVIAEGEALGLPEVDSFRIRVKFFDYGVLSFALMRHVSGGWAEVAALAQEYVENDALEQQVERICRQLLERFASAMKGTRQTLLAEDYLALAVTAPAIGLTSEELVRRHGAEIARIVRGERQTLSAQEQEDILRHSLSYFAEDLVVPTWNAAFIYDNDAGAQAALEILEFANSQLLEFRYYDELLDVQLGRIYAQLQERRWWDSLAGRRYLRAAHQLHALFIDVNELTDRTQNALKMVGDIYAARLFNLTASRLGLERWKASVEEKLKTLNDIYTFAVEQVAISRGHFLELTIILILVLELVLFFMGIMR